MTGHAPLYAKYTPTAGTRRLFETWLVLTLEPNEPLASLNGTGFYSKEASIQAYT